MNCKFCNTPTTVTRVKTANIYTCPNCGARFTEPANNFSYTSGSKRVTTSKTKKVKQKNSTKSVIPASVLIEPLFEKLSLFFPEYKERRAQIDLSKNIASAIENKAILLAEAGVGIGKTFAYLIPIIKNHFKHGIAFSPIIISTKTKNLQEQLALEDIPTINEFFHSNYGRKVDVLLSKGRRNYICREAWETLRKNKKIDIELHQQLTRWYQNSEFGDMEEKGAPFLSANILNKISADNCHSHCNYECKYSYMRDQRQLFQGIIVTNHNQLISHLRMISNKERRQLWFNPACLIIDEAHNFEEVARDELSNKININRLFNIFYKILSSDRHLDEVFRCKNILKEIKNEIISQISLEENIRQKIDLTESLANNIKSLSSKLEELAFSIDLLRVQKQKRSDYYDDLYTSINNAKQLVSDFYERSFESNSIIWAEKNKGIILVQAPFDIGPFLEKALWQNQCQPTHPVILTSATLSNNSDFKSVVKKLGIKKRKVQACCHPSPFDYEKLLKIYVPDDMPRPSQPTEDTNEIDLFTQVLAVKIEKLITFFKGKALILFTSHRRMEYVYNYICAQNLPYSLMKQGDYGPGEILRRFKNDTSSVLFATGAFWEGTDVAGEALSLLIMDKLPFPSPSDPVVTRMVENAKKNRKDPFQTVLLPEMLTVLRQGSGRLIRREKDSGIIALLDSRAWDPKYHDAIVHAMPPGVWLKDLAKL